MYQIFYIIHQWVSVAKAPAAEVIVASLAASWVCNCGFLFKTCDHTCSSRKGGLGVLVSPSLPSYYQQLQTKKAVTPRTVEGFISINNRHFVHLSGFCLNVYWHSLVFRISQRKSMNCYSLLFLCISGKRLLGLFF